MLRRSWFSWNDVIGAAGAGHRVCCQWEDLVRDRHSRDQWASRTQGIAMLGQGVRAIAWRGMTEDMAVIVVATP